MATIETVDIAFMRRLYDEYVNGTTEQKAVATAMKPLLDAYTAETANPTDVGFKSYEDLKVYSEGVEIIGSVVGYMPTDNGTPGTRPWVTA